MLIMVFQKATRVSFPHAKLAGLTLRRTVNESCVETRLCRPVVGPPLQSDLPAGWGNKTYVATSGLIVHPKYRGLGLSKRIKAASFRLARLRWPKAKLFSLTSGGAVMKMNTELGYVPVTFNELTDDEAFWKGCEACTNHDILVSKDRKFCICTAMLYDPAKHEDDTI